MRSLALSLLHDTLAVCRLAPDAQIPDWARGELLSITRTRDELSIVCSQSNVPDGTTCERDWRALRVVGQLEFALTGILVALATPLADAGISIFAVSTFDTDYILVRACDLEKAIRALQAVGHKIEETTQ